MIKKILCIFVLSITLLALNSCKIRGNVKLYLVKDLEYFTYKLDYVELKKKVDTTISDEDLQKLFEKSHGKVEGEFVIKEYKIFSDEALKKELGNDYKVQDEDILYVYLNAKGNTPILDVYTPSNIIYYTGNSIPDDISKDVYWPLKSLYVEGFYIPLNKSSISVNDIFAFFRNYRRITGRTMPEILGEVTFNDIDNFEFYVNGELIVDEYSFNIDESFAIELAYK